MLMETLYRLVGCSGSVFGVYETEREATEANDKLYNGNMNLEKYQIPYCIFLELFTLQQ